VAVIRALFSDAARQAPGVTVDDRFYPLVSATNEPGPIRPGGPPLYLGGQGPRGLTIAARSADGWLLPGVNAGDARYLGEKRDELVVRLEAAGRDPSEFAIVGQVSVGDDRRHALEQARGLIEVGATELILGMRAALGTAEADAIAAEVLAPLRDTLG
jgi:alkanesulfonate monooxygenase SsuD/methylene tetrahydromethanopterin reductase-like flavin-dependent oxidoreductase (luciferase family)